MPKYRLEIVRPECTGCELCTTTCPDVFEMAGDGLSTIKGGTNMGDNVEKELDSEGCAREAAADCPVNCIHLYEDGKQVV